MGQTLPEKKKKKKERKGKKFLGLKNFFCTRERDAFDRSQIYFEV